MGNSKLIYFTYPWVRIDWNAEIVEIANAVSFYFWHIQYMKISICDSLCSRNDISHFTIQIKTPSMRSISPERLNEIKTRKSHMNKWTSPGNVWADSRSEKLSCWLASRTYKSVRLWSIHDWGNQATSNEAILAMTLKVKIGALKYSPFYFVLLTCFTRWCFKVIWEHCNRYTSEPDDSIRVSSLRSLLRKKSTLPDLHGDW